ncbi:hypothetical protein ANCCEY_15838, partial [Ancylostoma ceylanicum]
QSVTCLCRVMDCVMWYFIVSLACLVEVRAKSPQCPCKNEESDFVIHAKVLEKAEPEYFDTATATMYVIDVIDTFKTKNNKTIENKVYSSKRTNRRGGPCRAALEENTEYILKGNFTDDGQKQLINNCGHLKICAQDSDDEDFLPLSVKKIVEDQA